jgi:ApeA N-terminal domain 1
MSILESRGVFWWHDEPVPDGLLAPDSHVVGTLKIDDDGRVVLELDGVLTRARHPMSAVMGGGEPETKSIQGILKDDGQRVLLLYVHKSGGQLSTFGISHEKFLALSCLVGPTAAPAGALPLTFIELEVGLEGFEQWLRLGSIETVREESAISAKYNKPDDAVYVSDSGALSVNFHMAGPYPGMHRVDTLSLKESASLTWLLKCRCGTQTCRRILITRKWE